MTRTSNPVITMTGVSCRFGHVTALREVGLAIPAGTVTALVGPNGAGKTTLLRVLATLTRASTGSSHVSGYDVAGQPEAVRRMIGYVGHRTMLYPDLTATENLRFHASLHGIESGDGRAREVLDEAGLAHRRYDRCRTFSRGTAQRLTIARAVLHAPPVLLLDEPHTGLDQDAARSLDEAVRTMAGEGRTVLLATHDLRRVSAIADRVIVLANGSVLWQGAISDVPGSDVAAWYRRLTTGTPASVEVTADGRRPGPAAASSGTPSAQRSDIGSGSSPDASPDASSRSSPDASPGSSPEAMTDGTGGSALQVLRAILRKDMTIEWRARESVPPVLVFALLVTVIFQFVLPPNEGLRAAAAPGVLWVALIFGTTLGFARLLGAEVDNGGLTGLAVSPIDRGAVFAGKWLAAYVFSLVVAGLLLPALVALLGLPMSGATILALGAIAALALVGWAATGVMLGTIAVSARAREVLLPVLLYPLVLPLVVPAVNASATVISGGPLEDLAAPLVLIVAYDIVFWVMGFLLYGQVMED